MADVLGTWNVIKVASSPSKFAKTDAAGATDQALNAITLPNIANATIQRVVANLFVTLSPDTPQAAKLQGAQEIQVDKTGATYIDAINLLDGSLESTGGESVTKKYVGNIDVSSEVDVFNDTYEMQWENLQVQGDDVEIEAQVELEVWYTLDSGVEDKVDDLTAATIIATGAAVTDGSNTDTTFKTNLPSAKDAAYRKCTLIWLNGNNILEIKEVASYDATKFITMVDALTSIPVTGENFVLVAPYVRFGEIPDRVWNETLSEHTAPGTVGEAIDDIHGKLPSKAYLRGTADSDGGMDTEDKADINAEADQALSDYDPPTRAEATSDKNEIIAEVDANEVKIDDVKTQIGTAGAGLTDLGGMSTGMKAEVEAEVTDALNAYDPPTRTEATADKDEIIVEVNANETKIDNLDADLVQHDADVKGLIGTPAVDVSTDIAANLSAIQAIQNNTRFTAAVPNPMQKPDAGDKSYRHAANLYDTQGDMEDPDNSEILVRIIKNDGTFITANLYKENALSNALDDPTDTGTFPPASGWRAMEREAVGKYFFFYKVASTETEEPLTVEFGWDEGGQVNYQSRATKISDVTDDIEDILVEVTAIGVKVDSGTPSPTIPAQITTHDTDIKGLKNVKACPDQMFVPAGSTTINQTGGITAIDTTVQILSSADFFDKGVVLIDTEYIEYDGIVAEVLQITQRGALGSTPAIHADLATVKQVIVYPIRLVIHDNENNMVNADSLPTIEIESWDGTQEVAPTNMTSISTGVYGYNLIIEKGDDPINKILKFEAVVDTITTQRRCEVVVTDIPASTLLVVDLVGGGTGDFILDQDGWYDAAGIKTLWTDVAKGYVRDADTGAPLDDAYVTAYPIINGETKYSGRPTGQARTRSNGTYLMALDYNAEGYTFVIEKDGFRIVGDGVVERTVGP
jgi:hypothetical protein